MYSYAPLRYPCALGELHRFKEPAFHAKINVCMGMKHWDSVMKSDWAFPEFPWTSPIRVSKRKPLVLDGFDAESKAVDVT